MKNEDFEWLVNEFIEQEKNIDPNPFAVTRIMAAVQECESANHQIRPVWQGAAIALAFAGAVLGGITLGNSYNFKQTSPLTIDDRVIENINFYNSLAAE